MGELGELRGGGELRRGGDVGGKGGGEGGGAGDGAVVTQEQAEACSAARAVRREWWCGCADEARKTSPKSAVAHPLATTAKAERLTHAGLDSRIPDRRCTDSNAGSTLQDRGPLYLAAHLHPVGGAGARVRAVVGC